MEKMLTSSSAVHTGALDAGPWKTSQPPISVTETGFLPFDY